MSQNFVIASIAWIVCFVATYAISLFTAKKDEKDLVGLVYSLTPQPEKVYKTVFQNPMFLAAIVIGLTLLLNLVFL